MTTIRDYLTSVRQSLNQIERDCDEAGIADDAPDADCLEKLDAAAHWLAMMYRYRPKHQEAING